MPKRVAEKKDDGRLERVLTDLKKLYPEADCELDHADPLQLLVSTILSAQCTDERVNKVTPELFRRFRTAKDFANVPREELEECIRSTGFFRSKAKSIQGAATKIVEEFAGRVPETMEELVKLPGVGRKTANVVLGTAFGKNEGIVVDTHVIRLSNRLGFTKQKDPEKIEQDLLKVVPRADWTLFSHQIIWHGRRVCRAIKPKCAECRLEALCPASEL